MVRWARYDGQAGKKRELEASSWQQLKGETSKSGGKGGPSSGSGGGGGGASTSGVSNGGVQKRFLPAFMRDTRDWSEDLRKVVADLRENGATEERIEEIVKKDLRRERRRLKRIKIKADQKCCFQCRKPGHTMMDCPETSVNQDSGAGICFKCGSTEHTSARCKAKVAPGEFPFAVCFVCNQKGHLASKCPDNPRGLYPNGGGCTMCGSVEHFRRDCPEADRMRGIDNIALDTLDGGSGGAGRSADATEDVPLATMPTSGKDKRKKEGGGGGGGGGGGKKKNKAKVIKF